MGFLEKLVRKFFTTCLTRKEKDGEEKKCGPCESRNRTGGCESVEFKLADWYESKGMHTPEHKLSALFNRPLPAEFENKGFKMPKTADFNSLSHKPMADHLKAAEWLTKTTFEGVYGPVTGQELAKFYAANSFDWTQKSDTGPGAVVRRILASIQELSAATILEIEKKRMVQSQVAILCSLLHNVFTREEVIKETGVQITEHAWAEAGIRHALYSATGGSSPEKQTTKPVTTRLTKESPKMTAAAKFILANSQKLAHKPNVVNDGQGNSFILGGLQRKRSPEALYRKYLEDFEDHYRVSREVFFEVSCF